MQNLSIKTHLITPLSNNQMFVYSYVDFVYVQTALREMRQVTAPRRLFGFGYVELVLCFVKIVS